jgi:hypothetical protein
MFGSQFRRKVSANDLLLVIGQVDNRMVVAFVNHRKMLSSPANVVIQFHLPSS